MERISSSNSILSLVLRGLRHQLPLEGNGKGEVENATFNLMRPDPKNGKIGAHMETVSSEGAQGANPRHTNLDVHHLH